jgi:RNA polymerase sigma factor (sigma-70 family)
MPNDNLFHKIYLSSRKSISRVVSRMVPPDEIEDIVQETYVRICQIEHKESINSPKSFMYKTARNLALDFQKQANTRLVSGVDDIQEIELLLLNQNPSLQHKDEMYEKAVTDSEFSNFCEAVRQLPIQCRKAFVLKKVYGYSQREIAQQLSISESTVEKHISLGLKRCTLFMRKQQNQQGNNSNVSHDQQGGAL